MDDKVFAKRPDKINIKNIINDRILNTHRVPLDYTIEEDNSLMIKTIEDEDSLLNKEDSEIKSSGLICYDMSGFFSPIAIRDQVIRAYRIIKRAIHHGVISAERNRKLLVVGGGIAGMVAAIIAEKSNIRTVLIERWVFRKGPLTSNRDYCPVQYDWSYNHWSKGVFPLENDSIARKILPFELKKEPVEKSLTRIQQQFLKNIDSKKLMSLHEACDLNDFTIVKNKGDELPFLRTKFKQNPEIKNLEMLEHRHLPDVEEFGMGLSCVGFGEERVFIKQSEFRGAKFWEFTQHRQFITSKGKILICGSGDGALQEFLICVTQKRTAVEVFGEVFRGIDRNLLNEIENNIKYAEDDAKKYELWLNSKDKIDKKNLCQAYRELHSSYEMQVNRLLQEDSVQKNLERLVKHRAFEDNITVSFLCNHFSGCYPLNRFLTILIGKYIDIKRVDKGRSSVFKEYSTVIGITGTEDNRHICNSEKPNICQNYDHKVTIAEGFSCRDDISQAEDAEVQMTETYQTILIRYGIMPPVPVFKQAPNYPGHQIFPLTLLDLDD